MDPVIFDFLKQLTVNNDKVWFADNKPFYQEAKKEFELYIEKLIGLVSTIDPKIGHPHAKDCIFRIYRDIRFGKDKTPYKNNFGAYMAHGGRKSPFAGYYFHLEPDNSFAAGGIYCPQPKVLSAVREEISNSTQQYRSIITSTDFVSHFPDLYDDRVKTAPRGYATNHPAIEYIRYKSFVPIKMLSDEEIQSENLTYQLVDLYKSMKPFNDYINKSVSYAM